MKTIRKRGMMIVLFSVALIIITGCGGGGGSNTGGGGAFTISGIVHDEYGAPVSNVSVSVRKSDNSIITSSNTAGNGTYTITNVPASTGVYLKASKATYASMNSELFNVTASIADANLVIVSAALMKNIADAYNGSVGGASWTDLFYTSKSWLALSPEDSNGNPIPGVGITTSPSGPTILYNDTTDHYSTTGPTTAGGASMPVVGGYSSSAGIYTFTLTKSPTTHNVMLPLILGEFSIKTITW